MKKWILMSAPRSLLCPLARGMIVLGLTVIALAAEVTVEIASGDFDRRDTVVEFALPGWESTVAGLKVPSGQLIPLQVDEEGVARCILPAQPAHTLWAYRVVADGELSSDRFVQVKRQGDRLELTDQNTFLSYQAEPGKLPRPDIDPLYTRGGYLHPVMSPAGFRISEDFPHNHIHHHGIWFPWTKTEFRGRHPDFWNMGKGTGRVEFTGLDSTWSGPVHGGLVSRHEFVDLTASSPEVALNETWTIRAYPQLSAGKPHYVFDLKSVQICHTADPLKLPEYHYGGLGFRGLSEWDGKENCHFLTSEGITDRIRGHATRADWCHIYGNVGAGKDRFAGVSILSHPQNFRAPQPMRIHPTEPFFCFAPSQLGDWEIASGVSYVSRYRFVVTDGEPDAEFIKRVWNDYAHPPGVTVRNQ